MNNELIYKLFFLFISIHIRMDLKETEHHIKDMYKRYLKDENVVTTFSPLLRNSLLKYIELKNILND